MGVSWTSTRPCHPGSVAEGEPRPLLSLTVRKTDLTPKPSPLLQHRVSQGPSREGPSARAVSESKLGHCPPRPPPSLGPSPGSWSARGERDAKRPAYLMGPASSARPVSACLDHA